MQPRRASAAAAGTSLERRADAVRSFNRFYTRKIGVLQEKLLHGPFSLTEVRVLYELAHRDEPTASDLSEDLGLDPAYLSRMLRAFERRGLVKRRRSALDGRSSLLALTPAGKRALSPLEERARQEIAALLRNLSGGQQRTLLDSMKSIEELLGSGAPRAPAYLLRPLDPGDVGWVVERIGSVFLVQGSRRVAKLRLLLVEPSARGLGVGSRLVEECIRFARLAGYRRLTLWTQSVLAAARRIYQRAGFHLVRQEKHHSFGHDLVGETWELDL